ncbi:hypothetical protein [Thermobifida alba]|nr:hypothetical protein [Thermobifida alba]HLU97837.1 hypothetical protein [Thermobifida alba]
MEQAAERFAVYAEAGVDELVLSLDGEDHALRIALAAEARSLL